MDTTLVSTQPHSTPLWPEIFSDRSTHPHHSRSRAAEVPEDRALEPASPSQWSLSSSKRCLDFAVAAAAILISWPLLLLTAIIVRLESSGPVIFRQKRVGRGGALFTVYKFRTMEVTAQPDGPSMTKRGDPRITRFGRFLRKRKLDELPQLFNVLRGDMSLIGPRPRLPHHMEVTNLPFRPGLTGAATLAFRCEEEMLQDIPDQELEAYNASTIIPLKGKLDADYMGQATFASDFVLLCQTATCCISGRPNTMMIDLSR